MYLNPKFLLCGLLLVLLTSGCQSTGGQRSAPVEPAVRNSDNPVLILAAARPFTLVRLKPGNELGLSAVMTGERYRAASGRVCKALLDEQRMPVGQLVCNKGNNDWYVQKALSIQGSTSTFAVSASNTILGSMEESKLLPSETIIQSADAELEDVVDTLRLPEETLWSFSQRVTGSGVNWKTIAASNGISDARAIGNSKHLKVPSHLLKR